jgi:hypothetical protein
LQAGDAPELPFVVCDKCGFGVQAVRGDQQVVWPDDASLLLKERPESRVVQTRRCRKIKNASRKAFADFWFALLAPGHEIVGELPKRLAHRVESLVL